MTLDTVLHSNKKIKIANIIVYISLSFKTDIIAQLDNCLPYCGPEENPHYVVKQQEF